MQTQTRLNRSATALALATVLLLSPVALACGTCAGHKQPIVIRQTIPYPQAVKRSPLTSDRLSTTSTRFIDARRGFRPYSSVYGDHASHHRYAAYDDHFGISRPENRPWSYAQRTPRSYVSQFRNDTGQSARPASHAEDPTPGYALVLREQPRAAEPKVDMKIRVHRDTSAIPTTTGAVLITADGTVIQVGD